MVVHLTVPTQTEMHCTVISNGDHKSKFQPSRHNSSSVIHSRKRRTLHGIDRAAIWILSAAT